MTHPTTDALYEAVGPGITGLDPDGLLLDWLDGPVSLLGEVDDVVRDGPTYIGWAGQLTADGSARLAWTGQFLGVVVPDGLTDAEKRALILDRPATRRGTVGALIAAAQQFLTGGRYVAVKERDTSAYHLTVTTYTEETPDAARVNAALQAAKPAGLVLVHVVVAATSYAASESMAAQTYTDLEALAVKSYTDLEAGL